MAQEMFKQVYLGEARGHFRAPHPTNLIGKAAPKTKRWVHVLCTRDRHCSSDLTGREEGEAEKQPTGGRG